MNSQMTLFIVDDDPTYSELVKFQLEELGYTNIHTFLSGEACIMNLHLMPDVILLDYNLGDTTGIEVMKNISGFNPDIQVIFMSSQKSIEIAVDSLKYGAYDYLQKDDQTATRLSFLLEKIEMLHHVIHNEITRKKKSKVIYAAMIAVAACSILVGKYIL